MSVADFTAKLEEAGIEADVAAFIWEEFQAYYFQPLTPYPSDRPLSEFKIDGDDLSEMITTFEKKFNRRWIGTWVGPDDPTLIEFGAALVSSTTDE